MLGTHCSNEGHLLYIWQRKIVFIKSKGNKMLGHAFYSLSKYRLYSSMKTNQLQKSNQDGVQNDNQK